MEQYISQNSDQISMPPSLNVYTLRLHTVSTSGGTPIYTEEDIINAVKSNGKFITYLIFKEDSVRKRLHYHVRISTPNTKKSMYNFLSKKLPLLKGNQMKSLHCCKVGDEIYDKSLLPSKTYVAKDGDCISSRGYTTEEITALTLMGSQIQKNAKRKAPVYQQIIDIYQLKEDMTPEHINDCICDYYRDFRKSFFPNDHIFLATQEKVLVTIYPKFRKYRYNQKRSLLRASWWEPSLPDGLFDKGPPL